MSEEIVETPVESIATAVKFSRSKVVELFHKLKIMAVDATRPNALILKKIKFLAENFAESIPEGLTDVQNALLVDLIAAVKSDQEIDIGEPKKKEAVVVEKAGKNGKHKEGSNGKVAKDKSVKEGKVVKETGPRKMRTGLFSIAYGLLEKSKKPLAPKDLLTKMVEKELWPSDRNLVWDNSNLIQALRKNAAKGKDSLVKEEKDGTWIAKAK